MCYTILSLHIDCSVCFISVVKYFSVLLLTYMTSAVCNFYEWCVYDDMQCCGSVMNDGVAHITLDYSTLRSSIQHDCERATVRIVAPMMGLFSQERNQC